MFYILKCSFLFYLRKNYTSEYTSPVDNMYLVQYNLSNFKIKFNYVAYSLEESVSQLDYLGQHPLRHIQSLG